MEAAPDLRPVGRRIQLGDPFAEGTEGVRPVMFQARHPGEKGLGLLLVVRAAEEGSGQGGLDLLCLAHARRLTNSPPIDPFVAQQPLLRRPGRSGGRRRAAIAFFDVFLGCIQQVGECSHMQGERALQTGAL